MIYTRSNLLPALVSSKVHSQVEFLAVGSWWCYDGDLQRDKSDKAHISQNQSENLRKIPGGREDVFTDKSIDLRSARALMKLLKTAADEESFTADLEEWGTKSVTEYLSVKFKVPTLLQESLTALTLSPFAPSDTSMSFALPRIHRHLTSIGIFGPGFGSVIPKWGGLSEIAQVGCRAGAVGGGVYVLKKGLTNVNGCGNDPSSISPASSEVRKDQTLTVKLEDGETIRTKWLVGTPDQLPRATARSEPQDDSWIARSITIVSSSLSILFAPTAEGAPPPASAVVVCPPSSLTLSSESESATRRPHLPVYLTIHSSYTGECPEGQCMS